MALTAEEIVPDVARNLLIRTPLATLSLDRPRVHLGRPAVSHADWRGLSPFAVAAFFRHLPVPDLLRLGYLFTPRWREVWRRDPLHLHDRQFASLPIPRSEVADAIANVLEEYVPGAVEDEDVDEDFEGAIPRRRWVKSFRVESTEWRPDQAARWSAALERGGAREVFLLNRGVAGQPPELVRVPPPLLRCTAVRSLHLAFFTVEAGELDALTHTMDLGLHGCACSPGVVEGVVAACRYLENLWVHGSVLDSVVVRSASSLRRLSMLRTFSRSLTVDDVRFLYDLLPGSAAVLSISGLPQLSNLKHLDLSVTTLQIDGAEIAVGRLAMEPQMPSVRDLWLALDYAALRGMEEHMVPRVLQQMLMRFPRVHHLIIERKDDVLPEEEGVASLEDGHTHGHLNLYDGLVGVAQHLHTLTLFDFRAGKAELALVKALLDSTQKLRTVKLAYSPERLQRLGSQLAATAAQVHVALWQFAFVSPNQSLRGNRQLRIISECTTEIEGRIWGCSDSVYGAV